MTDLQCKVEADIRATLGTELLRDGWIEIDKGLWFHSAFGTYTIFVAYEIQSKVDLRLGRQAILLILGVLATFYGILILIAKWNYICELLDI